NREELQPMKCCPFMRWFLMVTPLVGGTLIGAFLWWGQTTNAGKGEPKTGASQDWTMLGGNPQRNAVNTVAKDILTDWTPGKQPKNIKWVAQLGSRAYGGPIIVGGKVYVGTNNERPRDKAVKGPKAILLCFQESDGKFLWQAVHEMPPREIVATALKDGL